MDANTANVLLTSAGRRVSLMRAFETELAQLVPNGTVFTADCRPELSSACELSAKAFTVPRLSDPAYLDSLLRICRDNSIALLVPTIDTELQALADASPSFAEHGISVVISDSELVRICRDKLQTSELFKQLNVPTPEIIDKSKPTFPLFVKPIAGSSSVDIQAVLDESMLAPVHLSRSDLIFMEYLSPKLYDEYTVDMYFDRSSTLRCAVPRLRLETRGGEISKGVTARNEVYDYVLERFSNLPGARGCITLQLFKHKERAQFFGSEINARFGGGYPLSYSAGANYPRWIIEEYLFNRKISDFAGWSDGMRMLRYDSEVYLGGS